MGIDRSLKYHLLETRIRDIYGRLETRCGLLPDGDNPHAILTDWENRVHLVPKDGLVYCKRCSRNFRENG